MDCISLCVELFWIFTLNLVELVAALLGAVSWGTGLAEKILGGLVNHENCTHPCLQEVRFTIQDWETFAAILYGVAAIFAAISLVGVLTCSGCLMLPNIFFCIVKIPLTIWICEGLLDATLGTELYRANRAFMYTVTIWNMFALWLNMSRAQSEYMRRHESGDELSAQNPWSILKALCSLCKCCKCSTNAYEVNSNIIRLPLQDAPDGEDVADKHSVVDMGEESLSDLENFDGSVRSEGKALNDSGVSGRSEERVSPKASGQSGKRKLSEDETSNSGDDFQSGTSPASRHDVSIEDAQDVQNEDQNPLLDTR